MRQQRVIFREGGLSQSHEITNSPERRFQALEAATRQSAYRYGSRLPAEVQEVVAGHLRAGCSMSEAARRAGVSRDRVRTIFYALHGLTLAEYRRLKARSKVAPAEYVSVASLEGGLDVAGPDPDWFCS